MGLKHLREQNKEFNINIVDLVSKLDPTKTNKLTPFLVSMMKKRMDNSLGEYFGDDPEYLKGIFDGMDSSLQKSLLYFIVDFHFGFHNVSQLKKFSDYLERGLIENKDILKYKDFGEIEIELSKAITKELMSKVKKEVLTVYEDDDWWMFKPLTHDTSVVYGYGTKWCTSMKNEPEYFYRHSNRGILIYIINKKTNRKFGCHRFFNEPVRLYDEPDQQIDSFETGMDTKILKELFELMKDEKPNYHYFSDEEKRKADNYEVKKNRRIIPLTAPVIDRDRAEEPILLEEPTELDINNGGYDDLVIDATHHHGARLVRMGDMTSELVRQMISDTLNTNNLTDDLP